MRKIYNVLDYVVSVLLFLGFVFFFLIPERKMFFAGEEINSARIYNLMYIILGIIGLIYLLYALYRFFVSKIKFDWILVKEDFMHKVFNLTLLIPFSLTFLLILIESVHFTYDEYLNRNYVDTEEVNYVNDKIDLSEMIDIWKNADKTMFQTPLTKNLVFSDNLYSKKSSTINISDTSNFEKAMVFAEMFDWEIRKDTNDNYILYKDLSVEPNTIIDDISEDPSLFWSVYYHYIDAGNQHMATTEKGRKWAVTISVLGYLFLNGLLMAILIGWFDRRRDNWLKGEIRYKLSHLPKNRFAVVIGANEVAPSIIKNLLNEKKKNDINYKSEGFNKYVILQTVRDTQTVREELATYLDDKDLEKVIIYKALRNSKSEIEKLYLRHCTEIYVLGESVMADGGEAYHDTLNMKCVNIIASNLNTKHIFDSLYGRTNRKVCKVMFEYQTTYSIFQFSDVSETIKNYLVFIPFNRYESWARKVMVESFSTDTFGSIIEYTPLDGVGIVSNDDETHVHFVIVGMSKMGVAMGVQTLLQAHYVNYATAENIENAKEREIRKNKTRTRVTFIDTNADKEMDFFKGRYSNLFSLMRHRYFDANNSSESYLNPEHEWIDPMHENNCRWEHLSRDGQNFIDVEMEFVKGGLESEGVRRYLEIISDSNNDFAKTSKLTIAICLTQTHQSVAAALYMPINVYKKAQEIWVYQREASDIVSNLSSTVTDDLRYKKLRPFGMLYGEYMSDRTQYLRAMLVNGAYSIGVTEEEIDLKIDMCKKETYRHIKEAWRDLPLHKKFSNRYYSDSIFLKVRTVMQDYPQILTYRTISELLKTDAVFLVKLKTLIDDEDLAVAEHNRWNLQQLLFGYYPCDKDCDEEFRILNDNMNGNDRKVWKDKYDQKKKNCKDGVDRIHPNICEYYHLDEIDTGAKAYDKYLNKTIPRILELVDKHDNIHC
mgnify:CR=1 FL=1